MTSAPFALVLDFYERYRYVKLQKDDLSKICIKYKKQPEKVIVDLQKKYNFPISSSLSIINVKRLLALYPVPEEYANLIWDQIALENAQNSIANVTDQSSVNMFKMSNITLYDSALDVYSDLFNAECALKSGAIIVPNAETNAKSLENLSKCKSLIEGGFDITPRILDRTVIDQAKAIVLKTKDSHIFDTIANNCQNPRDNKCAMTINEEAVAASKSPLNLLEIFMTSKNRVQIVIRRKGGVKGIMRGFIQAFDKHFNLLMSDIDETVVPNTKKVNDFIESCI